MSAVAGKAPADAVPKLPAVYALRFLRNAEHSGSIELRLKAVPYRQGAFQILLRESGESSESRRKRDIRRELTWWLAADPALQIIRVSGCTGLEETITPFLQPPPVTRPAPSP